MVGQRIGGFVTVGGGLALYGPGQAVRGGIGVAGDHPCTGIIGRPARPDDIVYDVTPNPAGARE
jgi:hypothetical protein